MTNITTDHPYGIPYVELTDNGRKISFERDCLADVKILRRINDGDWVILMDRARSPYTDTEKFPTGTHLSYSVELEINGKHQKYELEAML